MDEITLVQGLRTGDGRAFVAVFETWNRPLLSYLQRMCGDRELAMDLLQETFIGLARSAPSLSAETRLRSWLFRVARNAFITHLRKHHTNCTEFDDEVHHTAGRCTPGCDDADDKAIARQTHQRIEVALSKLSGAHRDAILLAAQEFEPIEAAALVGVSPEAFRQRLHRARLALMEILTREETL